MVLYDGIGFNNLDKSGGHGLANMRARANRIGARFSLDGNHGTRLELDLSLNT